MTILIGIAGSVRRGSYNAALLRTAASLMPAEAELRIESIAVNEFDLGALLLLLIFSVWQMPHAYAIGILHRRDYSTVEIPVLPVKMGVDITRKHIILYILAFVAANLMLTVAGYTGFNFLAVAGITGAYWLYLAGSGYKTSDHRLWAQQMFVFSIVIIAVVNVMMSIDSSAYPIPAY
jgi:protoheme IX farnesyltransferase